MTRNPIINVLKESKCKKNFRDVTYFLNSGLEGSFSRFVKVFGGEGLFFWEPFSHIPIDKDYPYFLLLYKKLNKYKKTENELSLDTRVPIHIIRKIKNKVPCNISLRTYFSLLQESRYEP